MIFNCFYNSFESMRNNSRNIAAAMNHPLETRRLHNHAARLRGNINPFNISYKP